MSGSMNILTFDIEEWFHILETAETEDAEKWDKFETRIYGNTDRILNALEDSGSKATFFIVGWIAKRYPDIVKKISRKYEIGSHTGKPQARMGAESGRLSGRCAQRNKTP